MGCVSRNPSNLFWSSLIAFLYQLLEGGRIGAAPRPRGWETTGYQAEVVRHTRQPS